jgi:isopentenyl-diphosphate delta-isomerase
MLKDECIVVDEHDAVVGSANKYDCHRFVPGTPQGRLHRAFSVFLFDEGGRLLLQQRAASKITFPSVSGGGGACLCAPPGAGRARGLAGCRPAAAAC